MLITFIDGDNLMPSVNFQLFINIHDMIANAMDGNIHIGSNLIIGKSID